MRSYLPIVFHASAVTLTLLVWGIFHIGWAFLVLLFYVGIFFLFRSKKYKVTDSHLHQEGTYHSPINGKVVGVTKNVAHVIFGKDLLEIRLLIEPWSEMGLYLPSACLLKDISIKQGLSYWRWKKELPPQKENVLDSVSLILDDPVGEYGLQLVKCPVGMWPDLCVMPGDRGGRGAKFGYFPLGGTVYLYIPSNYEILVSKGQKVRAMETLIACAAGNALEPRE